MNQGKLFVGVAVVLGICAGLAGYWWNYRIGHRAMAFWGQENSRLIRLAPKVEYFNLETSLADVSSLAKTPDTKSTAETFRGTLQATQHVDLSQARGLIHLRNAILSDDQFDWQGPEMKINSLHNTFVHVLRFSEPGGKTVDVIFDLRNKEASLAKEYKPVTLGPLAKSLEKFLARELPRAEQDAAANTGDKQPEPAKSE